MGSSMIVSGAMFITSSNFVVYACLCCVMDVPMRGQNTFCTTCLKMYVIHCDSFPNKPTQVKLQTIAWSQCSPWRKPPHPLFARCAASSSHLRPEHLSLWSLKSPRGCNEHLVCRTPPDVGFQCKDGDQPKLMQSINITPPIVHVSHGNGKSIYRGFFCPKKTPPFIVRSWGHRPWPSGHCKWTQNVHATAANATKTLVASTKVTRNAPRGLATKSTTVASGTAKRDLPRSDEGSWHRGKVETPDWQTIVSMPNIPRVF